MRGYGQNGQEKGGAGLQPTQRPAREPRRRGGAFRPRQPALRNGGTPWRSLTATWGRGAEGSTGDATGVGWLKKLTPRGKPGDRRTGAQTGGRERGESEDRRDEHRQQADVAMAYPSLAQGRAEGLEAPKPPRSRRPAG
jgi:hypothetical protein